MNKILKCAVLSSVLPLSLLSYEIDFSKTFTKKLTPDILNSDIKLVVELDSEKNVSSKLEKFDNYIKDMNYVEKKLGTFNIRPRYKYKSNTPHIDGYIGEIKYAIESNDPKKISRFINGLIDLKNHRDTSIIVSNLSWKVKDTSANIAIDLLRYESITWIEKYAKNLSNDLKKKCEIKNINIHSLQNSYYRGSEVMYSAKSSSNASISVPQQTTKNIKMNVNYKLECK
ncbi:SIMPL domain-containing protein [Malaciobacter halophilus]|nr:SIMPL domain-containing protein [Malaciobacter halophilus]RYA24352.1 SIMPL domain-containing protein [Malaciobacter halophilus]